MYLAKTKDNYYKIRIRIPNELRSLFGRTEINKSLKTKSYREAFSQSTKLLSEYKRIYILHTSGLYSTAELYGFVESYMSENFNYSSSPINLYSSRTHKSCFDEFRSYYENQPISESKREGALNFLNNVFLHLVGADTPIKSVGFNEILEVKTILMNLPKRTKKKYRELSLDTLIKLEVPEEDRLTEWTLHGYIGHIKKFYNYCLAQKYIEVNPTSFISVEFSNRADTERGAFTKDELLSLNELIDKENELMRLVYYSLQYSGLRASELWKAKLVYDSDSATWYFDLTDKKLKLKTLSSYRIVPLHHKLVEMGLTSKFSQISTRLKKDYIQKYFNNKIKPKVTNSSKKVLYSYRHTFATELKYADVNPLVISELLGHSHEGMTMGRYASRYPLEVLKEAVEKLV